MTDAEITTAIANIADGTPNTALEIRDLLTELFSRCAKSKTVFLRDVTNQYIADNFDGTGLGINLELGYAMCNGNNGTRNWAERVPIAYGGTMTTMGEMLGSADTVVVSHTHTSTASTNIEYGTGDGVSRQRTPAVSAGVGNSISVGISTEGESGVGKNIQPSIVTLAVMKI